MNPKGIYSLYFKALSELKEVTEYKKTTLDTIMQFTTQFKNKKALLKYLKTSFNINYNTDFDVFISYRKHTKRTFLYKEDKALLNEEARKYLSYLTRYNFLYNKDFRLLLSKRLATRRYYQTEINVLNHEVKNLPLHTENLDLYSDLLIKKIFGDYHLTFSIIDLYHFVNYYQQQKPLFDFSEAEYREIYQHPNFLSSQKEEQLGLFKEYIEETNQKNPRIR